MHGLEDMPGKIRIRQGEWHLSYSTENLLCVLQYFSSSRGKARMALCIRLRNPGSLPSFPVVTSTSSLRVFCAFLEIHDAEIRLLKAISDASWCCLLSLYWLATLSHLSLLALAGRFTTFESALACLVSLVLYGIYQYTLKCWKWREGKRPSASQQPLLLEVRH